MAMHFWEACEDAIVMAIISCRINQQIVCLLPLHDSKRRTTLQKLAEDYERLALNLLDLCQEEDSPTSRRINSTDAHRSVSVSSRLNEQTLLVCLDVEHIEALFAEAVIGNANCPAPTTDWRRPVRKQRTVTEKRSKETTAFLIEHKLPVLGGFNCIELAFAANATQFLSSLACQNSMELTWNNGIHTRSGWSILALFCPFLLLFGDLFTFKQQIASGHPASNKVPTELMDAPNLPNLRLLYACDAASSISSGSGQFYAEPRQDRSFVQSPSDAASPMALSAKMKQFYSAPKSKFYIHSVSRKRQSCCYRQSRCCQNCRQLSD
ncbi:unnamed protein product [Protopolystoma xenopodis]|uniref:TRPM-like domain-containing protein n=1 Tax=Protopolystoma xenopodis TaxID=117903 RepID=A0A3S5CE01_9PLAT|nr:unnamed protein product [Protopolystoma xenopodis]